MAGKVTKMVEKADKWACRVARADIPNVGSLSGAAGPLMTPKSTLQASDFKHIRQTRQTRNVGSLSGVGRPDKPDSSPIGLSGLSAVGVAYRFNPAHQD